jgi:ribulose-5-phosphate 4-epimerase/fuculose-1-phosphate aldolase
MNHIASPGFSGEDFRSLLRNGPPRRSVEAERLHRKQRLAATFRLFSRLGFDQGLAGHVTARDPERTDHFWVNPLGRHFGQIRVSDLILVNHEGDVVEGDWPVNRAAFAIHSAIHTARPDVIAAAHTHSGPGKAFAALGRRLDPLTQDSCAFYEDHALFDDFSGVVLEASEGRRIAEALGNHKAVILKNHGLLTVADSVEAAAWWFIAFNDAAKAQLLAQAAGPTEPIPHDVAKLTASQVGTARGGLLNFHPLWESVLAEAPGFLQ